MRLSKFVHEFRALFMIELRLVVCSVECSSREKKTKLNVVIIIINVKLRAT